jgi:threonine dehydrogenase-like Zn-dependent dehydrogenase
MIDLDDNRLNIATKFGATQVINNSKANAEEGS